VLVVARREIDKQPLSAAGDDVPSAIVVGPLRSPILVCMQFIFCMKAQLTCYCVWRASLLILTTGGFTMPFRSGNAIF
jgi:hypothetical protein